MLGAVLSLILLLSVVGGCFLVRCWRDVKAAVHDVFGELR